MSRLTFMWTSGTTDGVAIWHGSSSSLLMSELGLIDGTVALTAVAHHCALRPQCIRTQRPLGRRLLLSRTLIADLLGQNASIRDECGERYLTIRIDHVGESGPSTCTYQLLPARWKNIHDEADSELLLAIWPDRPLGWSAANRLAGQDLRGASSHGRRRPRHVRQALHEGGSEALSPRLEPFRLRARRSR